MALNPMTQTWALRLTSAAAMVLGCSAPADDGEDLATGGGAAGVSAGGGTAAGVAPMPPPPADSGGTPQAVPAPAAGGIMSPDTSTDAVFVDDQSDVSTSELVNDETACAGTEVAPEEIEVEIEHEIEIEHEELKPLALYIVLDNSQSMGPAGGGGGRMANADVPEDSKWSQAIEALTSFITDDASAGIGVAIQYFHPQGVGDEPDECDGSGHGTPAVPMGVLPDNADALMASLDAAAPTGYTPTVGALTGGVQYCDEYQQANPDTTCVVVLVTDGQPRGCGLCEGGGGDCFDENSETVLTPIAAGGLAANVKTFAVGMDGITEEGFELLDAIAAAGGTDCTPDEDGSEACDVSLTGAQGFADALAAIRDSVITIETIVETEIVTETQTLECQWGIPEPPDGDKFYPDLVNVTLSKEGGEPADIGGVVSEAGCADTGGYGWYYDDPENPGLIHACPATCTEIETAMDPIVQVLLGCKTVPPPAR